MDRAKTPTAERAAATATAGVTRRTAVGGVAALAGFAATALPAQAQGAGPAAAVKPRAPDTGARLSRIAFGSCLHQDRPAPTLEAALAFEPDLFLFLGDNVYGDDRANTADLTKMRQAYETLGARDDVRALFEAVPILATWDDHDYGENDGGADYPSKEDAQALFLDFWAAETNDPRRSRPGVYSARVLGPDGERVQIILPDTRSFRTALTRNPDGSAKRYAPSTGPGASLLGEAQWRWLEEELKKPAEIRIVASSIQILADGHGWERWGNFPADRDRLYRTLEASGATGVVFLSGDRHLAAMYERGDVLAHPVLEVTSSSLNLDFLKGRRVEEAGPHRMTGLFTPANWGTVEIDWQARRLSTAVRDAAGTAVFEHAVLFSRMGL